MTTADLMRGAALDAFERLQGVAWQNDIESLYGPLAETMTWISALAEEMGVTEDPLMSGLMYARNCTLHRAVIVSSVSTQGPWAHSPLKGAPGNRFMGIATATIWGFLPDPEPLVPGMKDTPKRRADYYERVAGWEMFPRLRLALHRLRVNLDAEDFDRALTPRRPRREASLPLSDET